MHNNGIPLPQTGTDAVPAYAAPGILVRDLSLRLDKQIVFQKLNFTVPGSNIVALLGTSGAGKTSLLRAIAGLTPPASTSGSVTGSDGKPIADRIAWMGQKDLLYPWLTIDENITLGARLRGEKADRQWAEHLRERVGLGDYGRARPATLSGGMRQRAALARTLYERRPVVLMDEPFSALHTLTRMTIQQLAAEVLAQHTVLLVTHDPAEACRPGHRLLVLGRFPSGITQDYRLPGVLPRAADDAGLLHSQGKLLQHISAAG